MTGQIRVTGFDHLVLVVRDVDRSLGFYVGVLGLEPVRLEDWRAGKVPFVSVRIDDATILDLLEGEPTGVNVDHLCLVVDADIDALASSGTLEVESGPSDLFGARGIGRGLYTRDPDGHRIELRAYAR